jgi:hypothetical protein
MHKNTENIKASPKLFLYSNIIGVNTLFSAFPNYGKVIAIPRAKANYFPWNQNDIMLA